MEKELLLEELVKLNQMFGPKKSNKALHLTAQIWLNDLGHIGDETFLKCLSLVRQRCKFWPVPADVVEAYDEIVSRPTYTVDSTMKRLEHDPTTDGPSPEVMRKSVEALRDKVAAKWGMDREWKAPKDRKPMTEAQKQAHKRKLQRQLAEMKGDK